MAKTDNLGDFLKDVADSIRTKTGTTETINAQDFSDKILSIQTGGENTLKKLLDATWSSAHLFENYSEFLIDDLIQPNDTENVTNMNYMFRSCVNLRSAPPLNTSKVTSMVYMFSDCQQLTTVPQYDTSAVKEMGNCFSSCFKLTDVPQLNTSNAVLLNNMFAHCYSLTNPPLLNTDKCTSMTFMFIDCPKLTTIPLYNTSNVTQMYGTFDSCTKLEIIPALNVSKVEQMTNIFRACTNLKSILMTGMKVSFDISASTKFERTDLVTILDNLATVTTATTLTMGATNLAKLTDEDKAIATNKGWTLA